MKLSSYTPSDIILLHIITNHIPSWITWYCAKYEELICLARTTAAIPAAPSIQNKSYSSQYHTAVISRWIILIIVFPIFTFLICTDLEMRENEAIIILLYYQSYRRVLKWVKVFAMLSWSQKVWIPFYPIQYSYNNNNIWMLVRVWKASNSYY